MSILAEKLNAPHLSSFRARTQKVRFLALGIVVIITSTFLMLSPTGAAGNDLQKAKDAVAKAQKEADAAVGRYTKAESALEEVSTKLLDAQTQLDAAEESMVELKKKAQAQAKDAYIRSSVEDPEATYEDVVDGHRRDQFLATVSEFDDKQLNQLVGLQEDLDVTRKELTKLKDDRKETLDSLAKEKKALETKLNEASKAQKALEAKLAKEAKAASAAKKSSSSGSGGAGPGTVIVIGGGGLACPIQGAVSFRDTWGDARSGGRSHKGTDMFSPRGTPNVAVADGTVTFQYGGLGGNAAYVTSGGHTYYYAHLQSTVGSKRTVQRGEIIGYTGSSGNAGNAVHTHFEIRVGGMGGSQINPYATLRSIC